MGSERLIKFRRLIWGYLQYGYRNYIVRKRSLSVYSIDATVDKILADRCSIIRFGDGEMAVMRGRAIGFQEFHETLTSELISYAKIQRDDLLICIPDVFHTLEKYTRKSRQFWLTHLVISRKYWEKFFPIKYEYYNAFISRPYISYQDKSDMVARFEKIRSIWSKRSIVIIEGAKTRNGVVTGLFDNASQIERVICPSAHAYRYVKPIIASLADVPKDRLILVTLGPTAKVIVYRLYCLGFQALDIGQVDTEYKWFLAGTMQKIDVSEAEVLSLRNQNLTREVAEERYQRQIVARFDA